MFRLFLVLGLIFQTTFGNYEMYGKLLYTYHKNKMKKLVLLSYTILIQLKAHTCNLINF